jgi:hypothetical protein
MLERWDEVEVDLRVETTLALDEGRPPPPLLVAFAGPRPVAVTALRPFDDGDALQALIEVLALLLPLGTDRLALSLPGIARDPDPGAPPTAPADGQLLVLVATVEAWPEGSRQRARLHPLRRRGAQWQWGAESTEIDAEAMPLLEALGRLLERRDSLRRVDPTDGELHRQLARCVLLGHTVALHDDIADLLEPDRCGAGPGPPAPR